MLQDNFVAVTKSLMLNLNHRAGCCGQDIGSALGLDVNSGMPAIESLGIAVVFGQRKSEGSFGDNLDHVRS